MNHENFSVAALLENLDIVEMPAIRATSTGLQKSRKSLARSPVLSNYSNDAWGQDPFFGTPPGPPPGWGFTHYRTRPATPKPTPGPSQLTIKIAVQAVKNVCVGVCLDCIRGKQEDTACRVPHPDPWRLADLEYEYDGNIHPIRVKEPERPAEWESCW